MYRYKIKEKRYNSLFERFTEKTIKVVTLAQEEAAIAKHSKLYPEHLLLGIFQEGSGISARFLRAAGIKIEQLRERVNEIIAIRSNNSVEVISFSPAVKKVLKEAWDEAKSLGANYISPEHLFLSLLNDDNTCIIKLLEEFDVDINRIRHSLIKIIERKSISKSHPEGVLKPLLVDDFDIFSIFEESESSEIMDIARNELNNSKYEVLGTEHILLAMLRKKDSQLSKLLENLGISYEIFQEKLNCFDSRNQEYNNNECLFTPKAFLAINSAFELAKELGAANIKPEHILLGILREKGGIAYKILSDIGIDTDNLYTNIVRPIEKQKPITLSIIRLAKEEARRIGHKVVGTEQILLGILDEG